VLTVTGNAPVEIIKIGTATVNPTNYTIVEGVITLKKEYLATLAIGEKIFTLIFNGATLVVTVTISDTTQ